MRRPAKKRGLREEFTIAICRKRTRPPLDYRQPRPPMTMTDNPSYVARNLDDLPKLLAEIFSQCAEGGMVFPFIACAISPNGNVCVFRAEPAGNEILAEHYENEPFRLPMTITVVDQKNEVAVVGIDDGGNIVRH